ncbi:HoxN/HupN/NixA family nickel/cobalt transporter [Micromonospora sp. RHAY321]|uniref:HoxN/HupN/NixA family nickel/cobalt transporter n=1 Tax=Micromonospora sp. RHAY321 TaxID=2944807 RepID=UPI00207D70FD|nr:HoxN/HupN/NixA family nickel/cobalt transporter [Micromonospora sp. RHAY321]MCO1594929.1 HoxN/HupN/NixA family nickel/cobalt transporter [Micromonospora sp. RHAY321]
MSSTAVSTAPPAGRWSRAERARLGGIVLAVAVLHVAGWSLYLYWNHQPVAAGGLAGAGALAYVLGVRHAFDADHIAAIDDTTRLMLLRGRRPVGVGFFFALGHSAVVLLLALIVGLASANLTGPGLEQARELGATIAIVTATLFLALVAALNAVVLGGLARLWRRLRHGDLDERELDLQLLNRGLMQRVLGSRARSLVRSSWHMAPVGFLFGLGLETASEVTLLALSASTAASGGLPVLALLTLPLLFAAGMSAMDTADSLLMSRAYSWAYRQPARRLYYNLATTAMTVLVGAVVASVYLAGLLVDHLGMTALAGYAAVADHFEQLGYVVVGLFVASWVGAVALWKVRGYDRRYGTAAVPTEVVGERQ